jgi:hypothetical protein
MPDTHVLVIGDVSCDWIFPIGDGDEKFDQRPNPTDVQESYGGAWMLARYVKAALSSAHSGTRRVYSFRRSLKKPPNASMQSTSVGLEIPSEKVIPSWSPAPSIPSAIWHVKRFPKEDSSDDEKVYRVSQQCGYFFDEKQYCEALRTLDSTEVTNSNTEEETSRRSFTHILVSDLNLGFCTESGSQNQADLGWKKSLEQLHKRTNSVPCIFSLLPNKWRKAGSSISNGFWSELASKHGKRSLVLGTVNMLRDLDESRAATISRAISWERSAVEFVEGFESLAEAAREKTDKKEDIFSYLPRDFPSDIPFCRVGRCLPR